MKSMTARKPQPTEAPLPAIVRRINDLINAYQNGSVNAASRDCGIPQRTLARITKGALPRSDVIARIASFYNCSTDWLLTGQGLAPPVPPTADDRIPRAPEALQWNRIVKSLDLPLEGRRVLWHLPNSIGECCAAFVLGFEGQPDHITDPTHEMGKAMRKERQAWVQFFDDWIKRLGLEVVRREVMANVELFGRRFVDPARVGRMAPVSGTAAAAENEAPAAKPATPPKTKRRRRT